MEAITASTWSSEMLEAAATRSNISWGISLAWTWEAIQTFTSATEASLPSSYKRAKGSGRDEASWDTWDLLEATYWADYSADKISPASAMTSSRSPSKSTVPHCTPTSCWVTVSTNY
jgi:hypothetical protein